MDEHFEVKALIDEHITKDKVLRYVKRIADTPAPSTTSSLTRGRLIQEILEEENWLQEDNLHYYIDYKKTGNSLLLTGENNNNKPLWFFAHLDTISYLIQPKEGDAYPLVPFCYHLLEGNRELPAAVVRYSLKEDKYYKAALGTIFNVEGNPYFKLDYRENISLIPGDRIVFNEVATYSSESDIITGDLDNAVSAAALLLAAPILAKLGKQALLAFPDEEEGPSGQGNQTFGRGSRRLIDLFTTPEMTVVADLQKATISSKGNDVIIGDGAVLAEFSSMGRGAVTPPHLYENIKKVLEIAQDNGIKIQESSNKYTSRSDDINAFLKTPNVVLLGVPGSDRHFNNNSPSAALNDVLNLSKSIVYSSLVPDIINKKRGTL